jgi:hypothetical protein
MVSTFTFGGGGLSDVKSRLWGLPSAGCPQCRQLLHIRLAHCPDELIVVGTHLRIRWFAKGAIGGDMEGIEWRFEVS